MTMLKQPARGNTPALSRRKILAGLAAAPAATLPAGALALAAPSVAENPELMALAEKTSEVENRYRAALSTWFDTWNTWSPRWPLAPDCCVDEYAGPLSDEIERNLLGEGLVREGNARPLRIRGEKLLESFIEMSEGALKKKHIQRSRKGRLYHEDQLQRHYLALELLPAYRAECARIREASGIADVKAERNDARDAVYAHARKMLEMPSRTPVGANAKAEAARLIGILHRYDQAWGGMKDTTENSDGKPLAALMAEAMCSTFPDLAAQTTSAA